MENGVNGHHPQAQAEAHEPDMLRAAAARELNALRTEALGAVDSAPFSWFHVKICVIAGIGFFTDAYDVFAINLASVMLGYVYGHTIVSSVGGRQLSREQDFGIKVAAPIGNLFGQLFFGWLADIVGRKRMYGVELIIIVAATFAQALSGAGPAVGIVGVLIVCRFIMGVGIGGDYPLSAVITSEYASKRIRGRLMTAVFASQGWGNFFASLVAFVVVVAYKNSIIADSFDDPKHVDYCWRILIGLGCIPGVIALYFRLTIPETPRFTMDIDRDVQRAATDIDNVLGPQAAGAGLGVYWVDEDAVVQRAQAPTRSRSDFMQYFGQRHNLRLLFGVAYSWFAIDVAFYGLGLNSSRILTSTLLTRAGIGEAITPSQLSTSLGIYKTLRNVAEGGLVVSVAGLLPGYYVSLALIDTVGRKPIQYLGFSMLTILLAVLAGIYPGADPDSNHQTKAQSFVAVYCLANFFANFGPNVTTFIVPGELFPTRYRSTGHGIAAASGKLGAIVSQIIFYKVQGSNSTLKAIIGIFAGISLTGIASTMLLEETMDRSLERLSGEDEAHIRGVIPIELQNGIVHRHGRPQP